MEETLIIELSQAQVELESMARVAMSAYNGSEDTGNEDEFCGRDVLFLCGRTMRHVATVIEKITASEDV